MEEVSFIPLLIVVGLAFLVPLVVSRARRARIPCVVGEILAGMLVGGSGLGLVGHDTVLQVLSMLGFAYLMFLSGLEVDFEALLPRSAGERQTWRERLGHPLSLGVVAFALTLLLSLLAGWGLSSLDAADDPWLMALILSTTSLGLVMPVLKERGLTSTSYGQALLVAAVAADFATMLLVSVYVVLRSQGLTLELLLVFLLFVAFGIAYRIARMLRRRFPGLQFLQGIAQSTAQLDIRGAIAIGLAFIVLARSLGVEMILGAFLGGSLISLLVGKRAADMRHRLDALGYGFFIPIFFIMVGVNFDMASLLSSSRTLLLLPALLVLAYAIKFLAALVYRVAYDWRKTLAAGALLSSRLSLIIAVAAIGLELGSIDSATNSAIILVAITTCTLSPLAFNRLVPHLAPARRKFVVVGAGKQPRLLAQRIADHGEQVIVIDRDPARAAAVEALGLPFVLGDATDPGTWSDLEVDNVQSVAAMLPDEEANLALCRMLREEFGVEQVVARVREPTWTRAFSDLGVMVVNPSLAPVAEMEHMMLYPSVSSLMADLEDEHDVMEVRLECPDLAGRPLCDVELPRQVMIILIRRDGDVIYPQGDTTLRSGDRLTLLGPLDGVHEMAHRCNGTRVPAQM
ncbi:MAG: monovalent cation:proton antiporter family protein [Anaerolineae bacterium]|jgi:Kef-type K+ transport system membrane component KefB/Trk K+ transport system NAD-binding subunit